MSAFGGKADIRSAVLAGLRFTGVTLVSPDRAVGPGPARIMTLDFVT